MHREEGKLRKHLFPWANSTIFKTSSGLQLWKVIYRVVVEALSLSQQLEEKKTDT